MTQFDIGVLNGFAMEPDGGVVTVGFRQGAGGIRDAVAARLRPDGRRDRGFGTVVLPSTVGNARAHAAVVQPNGRIVVVGTVTDSAGMDDFAVWRLMPSGAMDRSFAGGDGFVEVGAATADETAFDVAVGENGQLVVAGEATATGSTTAADIAVLRLTGSGRLDPSFNDGSGILTLPHPGQDQAHAVAVQDNGDVLMAGNYDGTTGNAVLKVKPGTASTPQHSTRASTGITTATGSWGWTAPWPRSTQIWPSRPVVASWSSARWSHQRATATSRRPWRA